MEGEAMPWDDKISRRLKLKDLQTLMAVIEAGGIGKAADRLNYSQPAVSKAIANLERTVGKRLLERGRKGIELTAHGEALLKCGVAVIDDLKKGIEELDFISDPTAGEVRIGCSEPVLVGIVSATIDRVAQRYPKIVMHVVPGEPPELYPALDARKIDLVIVQFHRPVAHEHRHAEVLFHEPLVVVAGLKHPCARKRRVELAEIADGPWVLPPETSFISMLVTEAFRSNGLRPPQITVVSHLSAYLRLILASRGRFLTVVPEVMLRAGLRQLPLKVLHIELSGNRRPVGVITLKNRALSPAAQLFIEHARSLAKTMTKD
jgi:DNA-binding transcriptional LysR family regulator